MTPDDRRWMAAALALARRGQGRTSPNPNVGCIIVRNGCVVGRGWTGAGGRPHAEAVALAQAGDQARDATVYVTLEPCAHQSARGPCCTDLLIAAKVARVVIGMEDPDPRTAGNGRARLKQAGILVLDDVAAQEARNSMAGWLMQREHQRPFITLKLATSLDGCIALATGESRWITGEAARAHGHLIRSCSDMILVGHGTYSNDSPLLNVRLPGLEDRAPERWILSRTLAPPSGWNGLSSPDALISATGNQWLLIEGGASTAAAFLRADMVDRLLIYRAPILIGDGMRSVGDIGLHDLGQAHGRWRFVDARALGSDRLEIYDRTRRA